MWKHKPPSDYNQSMAGIIHAVVLARAKRQPPARGGGLWVAMAWAFLLAALPSYSARADAPPAEIPRPQLQPGAQNAVCHIRIARRLDPLLYDAFRRQLDEARDAGAKILIIEIDSTGGMIQTAIDFTSLIASQDVYPVAYVNKRAESVAALLPLACKEVYFAPGAVMGRFDLAGPVGKDEIPEDDPVRKQALKLARDNGFPEAVAEAMFSRGLHLFRYTTADSDAPRYVRARPDTPPPEKAVGGKMIADEKSLLTLDAGKAADCGVSSGEADDSAQLYKTIGADASMVRRLTLTPTERILSFAQTIAPVLIVVGFIAMFIEMSIPGHGAGIVSVACFGAFFAAKAFAGQAGVAEVAMFILGLTLLGVEIFLIPGFGVVGGAGIIFILVSLIMAFQSFLLPRTVEDWQIFRSTMLQVFGSVSVACVVCAVLTRYLPALPILQRMMLKTDLSQARVGPGAGGWSNNIPPPKVGDEGVALTDLMPGGCAVFGSARRDVVSQGDPIGKDDRIRIVEINGPSIVVKKVS